MFARQVEKQDGRAVFLEYAWDMKWCDPCAADPLSTTSCASLGVFWTDGGGGQRAERVPHPAARALRQRALPRRSRVPGDGDRANFQGRYVLRHAWTGGETCAPRPTIGVRSAIVARARPSSSRG